MTAGDSILDGLVDEMMDELSDALDDPQAHLYCTNCFNIYVLPPGTIMMTLCGEQRLRREELEHSTNVCSACREIRRGGECPYCGSPFINRDD